jgi:hemerythrin
VAIEWSPRLAVGVESIDTQHRELFARVNRLLGAMAARDSAAELERLVRFLEDYVRTHFGDEERLMRQHAYPGLEHHRRLHASFTDDLQRAAGELARTGPTSALSIRLNDRACGWLMAHVAGADRAFAGFLAGRRAPAGTP